MANTASPIPTNAGVPFRTVGAYKLLSRIGGGAMGSVYLAEHVHLQRLVVLKMLASCWQDNPAALARFRQEMTAIGRLKHPHIIAATDAGEADDCLYLVMEHVAGVDLNRLLRRHGRLPVADACELARQTAEGLTCIEAHGLVHRDIKPSNLLLGQDGVLRILDLGLARLHEPCDGQDALTHSHEVMGTGDFMAPEQGVSSHAVDIRADIYSLGCTLYALLAGQPPFAGSDFPTFHRKVKAHQEEPVPPIRSRRPDLPEGLSELLDEMLVKIPFERIAPPAEVARRLERYTSGCAPEQLFVGLEAATGVPAPIEPVFASTIPHGVRTSSGKKTFPREQKAWWRFAVLGLLAALLLVSLAGAVVYRYWINGDNSRSVSPHPTQEVRDPPAPEKWQPGVWHPLLERPPKVLQWPEDPAHSHWSHSPDKRDLRAACSGNGMLELANVSGPGFDLEMTLFQTPWAGGVGVFFRAREEPAGQAISHAADLLFLSKFVQNEKSRKINLKRALAERLQGQKTYFLMGLKSSSLAEPLNTEHHLRITVDEQGLREIRWDDAAVAGDLCDPQREFPSRPGACGGVGLYLQNSNAVVRNVRIRIHPAAKEKP
ncbi:MAG TPA: serine/threonine-protein kinase [Gemmataceae bacterium]|jgi:serine/threonine protein kinase